MIINFTIPFILLFSDSEKRKKNEMELEKNNKNPWFANSIPYAKPI